MLSKAPLDEVTVAVLEPPSTSVTIVALDDDAAEFGPNVGIFQVARTGPTNTALAVHYNISGTASNGLDFGLLSGEIVIPSPAGLYYVVSFTRRKAPTDLVYAVEVSSDVVHWQSSPNVA